MKTKSRAHCRRCGKRCRFLWYVHRWVCRACVVLAGVRPAYKAGDAGQLGRKVG